MWPEVIVSLGSGLNPRIIGNMLGSAYLICGGLLGCYFSIKNTNGPRERSLMIKAPIVGFGGLTIFLIALSFLPRPHSWFLWIPFSVIMALGIAYGYKAQQRIREQEAK